MVRRMVIGLSAGCLIACGASNARPVSQHGSAAAAARCGPASAHTLAASSRVRAYLQGRTVFACSTASRRSLPLGRSDSCLGAAQAAPVTAAGTYVAYGLTRCGIDTGSTEVVIRRVSDGRVLRRASATSPPGVEAHQRVTSLVLRASSAAAWIGVGNSLGAHTRLIELYRADRRGLRMLDRGPGLAPASLRLRGSRLSWRYGSLERHASLL